MLAGLLPESFFNQLLLSVNNFISGDMGYSLPHYLYYDIAFHYLWAQNHMGQKIVGPGECKKAEFHVLAEMWIKAGVIFFFPARNGCKKGKKKVKKRRLRRLRTLISSRATPDLQNSNLVKNSILIFGRLQSSYIIDMIDDEDCSFLPSGGGWMQ